MLSSKLRLATEIFQTSIPMSPTRDGYGEGVVVAGDHDRHVMVLCCDLTESTRSLPFAKKFPERFIEIGVAEQNMAGIAAGLAMEGKIPFISSYAVFSPGRNWDQIRVSICYNNLNVKVIGAHAGVSVGPDGATHQALEDIALMRVLPRMTVLVPSDAIEAKKATIAAAKMSGPVYIRLGREKTPVFTTEKTPFEIGRAEILWQSDHPQIGIIACGALVYEALMAANQLQQQNIGTIVVNNHTIKPLDTKTLLKISTMVKSIVTVEEHQVHGGLFGAVSEFYSQHHPMPIKPVAVMDQFGESGEPDELLKKFSLQAKDIVKSVKTATQQNYHNA